MARAQAGRTLRAPSAFAGIRDPAARSAALFTEAGKVLQHPRCLNCHPDGDRPSQGDGTPHQPAVQRGSDGLGVTTMRCATCHQPANFDPGRVPGNPKWRLAPLEMAWQKRTLTQICEQVKDRTRNGGHSLAEIVDHMAKDKLVGWAWKPGAGREPAPGTQATFGALVKAWADSGAACPTR
jgi:mono/diheme cytochrome c family protein